MGALDDLVKLVARLCLAALFLYEGVNILQNYQASLRYAESFHMPGSLMPLVILVQLAGGLAVALGWQTKLAALPLAGFCFTTAIFFHQNFAKSSEIIEFGKDIGLAGGFLLLFVTGAGRFAIGSRAGGRWK